MIKTQYTLNDEDLVKNDDIFYAYDVSKYSNDSIIGHNKIGFKVVASISHRKLECYIKTIEYNKFSKIVVERKSELLMLLLSSFGIIASMLFILYEYNHNTFNFKVMIITFGSLIILIYALFSKRRAFKFYDKNDKIYKWTQEYGKSKHSKNIHSYIKLICDQNKINMIDNFG